MSKKRYILLLTVFVCFSALAFSQSQPEIPASALPVPYEQNEFPEWATIIRRFEIVSIGVFPIMLFYTRFSFDVYRYVANGFDTVYAPWPFRNEFSYKPTDAEQYQMVLVAGVTSLIFAGVDAFLYYQKARKKGAN